MRRARDIERDGPAEARREEIISRTGNRYEAIVAIAIEARRLNSVPGVFLEKGEGAIPRAFENFACGTARIENGVKE